MAGGGPHCHRRGRRCLCRRRRGRGGRGGAENTHTRGRPPGLAGVPTSTRHAGIGAGGDVARPPPPRPTRHGQRQPPTARVATTPLPPAARTSWRSANEGRQRAAREAAWQDGGSACECTAVDLHVAVADLGNTRAPRSTQAVGRPLSLSLVNQAITRPHASSHANLPTTHTIEPSIPMGLQRHETSFGESSMDELNPAHWRRAHGIERTPEVLGWGLIRRKV